jgi:hypothetical protein
MKNCQNSDGTLCDVPDSLCFGVLCVAGGQLLAQSVPLALFCQLDKLDALCSHGNQAEKLVMTAVLPLLWCFWQAGAVYLAAVLIATFLLAALQRRQQQQLGVQYEAVLALLLLVFWPAAGVMMVTIILGLILFKSEPAQLQVVAVACLLPLLLLCWPLATMLLVIAAQCSLLLDLLHPQAHGSGNAAADKGIGRGNSAGVERCNAAQCEQQQQQQQDATPVQQPVRRCSAPHEAHNAVQNEQRLDCAICFESHPLSSMVAAALPQQAASTSSAGGRCGHYFCQDCMRQYACEQVQVRGQSSGARAHASVTET